MTRIQHQHTVYTRGFTLIEILIVIAIMGILTALVVAPFVLLNREQALTGSTLIMKTALAEARSKTVSAEGGEQYGVHVTEGAQEAVVFRGTTYASGASTNIVIDLHTYVDIASVDLVGGGEEIVFNKIEGGTSQPGEIVLREEIGGEYRYATVTIFSTGVIE